MILKLNRAKNILDPYVSPFWLCNIFRLRNRKMRIFRLERRTISTILILQTNNILQKQTKITIIYNLVEMI